MVAVALVVDHWLWPVALVVLAGSVALARACETAVATPGPAAGSIRAVRRAPYRVFMSVQYSAHLTFAVVAPLG